jgi:stress response protein YsnF
MSLFSSAAVRALAPHLMDLVKGVLPLFTPEKEAAEAPPEKVDDVQQRQIGELQQAATMQAKALQELAERSEASMRALEAELAAQKRMTMGALALAVVAALLAMWAGLR